MSRRRGRLQMIKEILELLAKCGRTKTEIIRRANLNFYKGQEILDFLMEKGLITKSSEKYSITDKGKDFLEKLRELDEFMI